MCKNVRHIYLKNMICKFKKNIYKEILKIVMVHNLQTKIISINNSAGDMDQREYS